MFSFLTILLSFFTVYNDFSHFQFYSSSQFLDNPVIIPVLGKISDVTFICIKKSEKYFQLIFNEPFPSDTESRLRLSSVQQASACAII